MRSNSAILLIEDEEIDVEAIEDTLKKLHVTHPLARVSGGEEAMAWLGEAPPRLPGMILLDLNLPGMSGNEVLKLLKTEESLKSIPVVVLTTSALEQNKVAIFKLSVAGYMVKPIKAAQFLEVMHAIDVYWTISELP